ncbi:histone-lysine n-methyltransferase setmar [Trichonephila clavipes]|nr:histone-lysine n-methyltransferase setmar [Trichonephila clavipes]
MFDGLGFNTVSYDRVKLWLRMFKAGNFSTEDEPLSGHPIEVDCDRLKQIIDQDRKISTRTVALELGICQRKQ